nr:ribonuclease D-like [Nerophis lumbriciformis]
MTGAAMSPVGPILVETDRALVEAAEQWHEASAVALDTEFVRTRTFFARLGLVQVATDEQIWLVDPLQLDPAPIIGLMKDRNVVKIFHSCSEDLEVLHRLSGDFPQPLFDTQLAAAFTGHGYSLGYSRLVERFHSVELPKGETRTDWTRRPLSSAQLRYAAQDVLYLLPIYRRLQSELDELSRSDWLREDLAGLMDSERFLPDPRKAYRKIKGGGRLDRRQRGLLRDLAAWRELEARRRDLPRNFVIREQVLIDVAQRQPTDQQQLLRIDGLDHGAARRFGDKLLRMVDEAKSAQR